LRPPNSQAQGTIVNSNIRANEIASAFQRYLASNSRSEIEVFSLDELRSTDEQLGQRDVGEGYRIAIRNRIKAIEEEEREEERRRHESIVRAWNIFVGVLVGLLIAALTKFF
jgi:uncharacterized membrane protein YccC